jgi:hypothetical protein
MKPSMPAKKNSRLNRLLSTADRQLIFFKSEERFLGMRVSHAHVSEASMSLTVALPESRKCRTRARECRTMAERFRLPIARDQMLKAASDFERMARDAEQREIVQGVTELKALASRRYLSKWGKRT